MTEYEYAVVYTRFPDEIHRGPWPESHVDDWIAEAEEDGIKPGVFVKAYRPVHSWTVGTPPLEGAE